VEKAAITLPEAEESQVELEAIAKVQTPGKKKVKVVAEFLGVEPKDVIKTMFYLADEEVVAALVRGDREVQSVKLKNLLSRAGGTAVKDGGGSGGDAHDQRGGRCQ